MIGDVTSAVGGRRRLLSPSLDDLWLLLLLSLCALAVELNPIEPYDFWWHLAYGRSIITSGEVPTVDAATFTQAGRPFFDQPWLAQVFMYVAFRRLGGSGLILVQLALIVGSILALVALCRRQGTSPRLAVMCTAAAVLVSLDNWNIRPQTYALPLFITALSVLTRWRETGRARLWLLVPVAALWTNVHGSFPLLAVLWACILGGTLIDRRWQRSGRTLRECARLAAWGLLSMATFLVHPQAQGIPGYLRGIIGSGVVTGFVSEWQSPLRSPWVFCHALFFLLLVVTGLSAWRARRRVPATDVLLLLAFALPALRSQRLIVWFGCVAAVLLARWFAGHAPRRSPGALHLNRAIAAFLLIEVVLVLPFWKERLPLPDSMRPLYARHTPFVAVARLQALDRRPRRLFHSEGYGSYLMWAWPELQTFIDPRFELFPERQWLDHRSLVRGEHVDLLAARYRFDGWLVDRLMHDDLLRALDGDPRWSRRLETNEAVYYEPR